MSFISSMVIKNRLQREVCLWILMNIYHLVLPVSCIKYVNVVGNIAKPLLGEVSLLSTSYVSSQCAIIVLVCIYRSHLHCMPCIFAALHNGSGEHWPQGLVRSHLVHVEILPQGARHAKGSFQTPILCQVQRRRQQWVTCRQRRPREVAQHQQVTSRRVIE